MPRYPALLFWCLWKEPTRKVFNSLKLVAVATEKYSYALFMWIGRIWRTFFCRFIDMLGSFIWQVGKRIRNLKLDPEHTAAKAQAKTQFH